MYGDINSDGEVTSSDLGMLINMITGSLEETPIADLNNDGIVNSASHHDWCSTSRFFGQSIRPVTD